jgi:hypothetical protein
MLSRIKPKHLMIFGILAMLIGLMFFALWNVVDMPHVWRSVKIVRWATRNLGRYGISSLYFFGGVVVFLKGYTAMRSEERSRNIQQQQPTHYLGNQQQPPQWPGNHQH